MTHTPSPGSPWLRLLIGIALSALSAALLLLALPPTGIWPFALIGLIPALVAQYRILPRRVNSLASAISIGGYIGLYILNMMPDLPGTAWIKAMPLVLVALVYVMDIGTRTMNERTGYRWFVLQGAIVWVGIEMIRSLIPFLGTGGFIAYAYSFTPALIQPVSVFGIFGLSLVTMLMAYALGLLAVALIDRLSNSAQRDATLKLVSLRQAMRWLSVALVVALGWVSYSLLLFRALSTPTVRVAAIQPRPLQGESVWDTLVSQTRQAAAQGAQVIVWPEGILSYDPQSTRTADLKSLASQTNAYLVIGYGFRTPQGIRDEATVLSPEGNFLGIYGKDHPVVWAGETSLTSGTYPTFQTSLGTIGTIICYDLVFVDTARKIAAGGAQLIGVPSNDWPALSDKEYTHLIFRAVENHVAMVKADTRYDSAVIDPYGRVLASAITPQGERALIVADVPLGAADAAQITLGDWVGWLSILGLAFFALPNPLLRR